MSRHHDGYVRQTWAPILCSSASLWTVPYLLYLISDYVVEITETIKDTLTDSDYSRIRSFVSSHDIDALKLSQRIFTYWDIYYRSSPPRYPKLSSYPPYQIMLSLELWNNKVARHIIRKETASG
ncbi:hypothetical protein [Rubritalea tangerina]|uniref:hypothetical protein n=1 Tax=Rubritalea tangerina TaxID=430798 RepID=UPI00361D5B08